MSRWLRFLRWFCPPSLYEGIEGDLLEQFKVDVKVVGQVLLSGRRKPTPLIACAMGKTVENGHRFRRLVY